MSPGGAGVTVGGSFRESVNPSREARVTLRQPPQSLHVVNSQARPVPIHGIERLHRLSVKRPQRGIVQTRQRLRDDQLNRAIRGSLLLVAHAPRVLSIVLRARPYRQRHQMLTPHKVAPTPQTRTAPAADRGGTETAAGASRGRHTQL